VGDIKGALSKEKLISLVRKIKRGAGNGGRPDTSAITKETCRELLKTVL